MNTFTEDQRVDTFIKVMKPCVENGVFGDILVYWLIRHGFFKAPASIHHHGAYEGALFDHSLAVTNSLLSLTKRLELKWQREESPLIVGMFHDLCKVDNYEPCEDGESWKYKNAPLLTGHGDKSVIMALQHMNLTDEEIYCIRWHMGAFDDKGNWNSYGHACTVYPNVLYTHTADMIAARILGV